VQNRSFETMWCKIAQLAKYRVQNRTIGKI
jgi:hypothetical protein